VSEWVSEWVSERASEWVNECMCGHIWICEGGSVTEDGGMHLWGCAVYSARRQSECGAVWERGGGGGVVWVGEIVLASWLRNYHCHCGLTLSVEILLIVHTNPFTHSTSLKPRQPQLQTQGHCYSDVRGGTWSEMFYGTSYSVLWPPCCVELARTIPGFRTTWWLYL
jgi:hypothetical protein